MADQQTLIAGAGDVTSAGPTGAGVRAVLAPHSRSRVYPECVGSSLNDVMAVYVNGVNCATVPGTTAPVSVNTINAARWPCWTRASGPTRAVGTGG